MQNVTIIVSYCASACFKALLHHFNQSSQVKKIIVIDENGISSQMTAAEIWKGRGLTAGGLWNELIEKADTPYLLLIGEMEEIRVTPEMLGRFVEVAEASGAAMVYSDYYINEMEAHDGLDEICPVGVSGNGQENPVNDYQEGSVRDDFDFGPVVLLSTADARKALQKNGPVGDVRYAGFYDLRLKMSVEGRFYHLREFLYEKIIYSDGGAVEQERQFAYVDPRNDAVQNEMERVFTDYLKVVGAYLEPGRFKKRQGVKKKYPVEASVIIPVRNRERTIAEAIQSALSQETDFPFDVIVVDNHSTDGTTKIIKDMAATDQRLKHIVPRRCDLNIGGCWNEAVRSDACGRFAVQLDSDDLYSGTETLQKIIEMFRQDDYAMVIGAYTLVNEHLEVIPPGLIDHREWTAENGRNNALRVNGLGAPRAFDTDILRKTGFLNVGYGEDYAVSLRLSREYTIGRIFESLYLCRRWTGNTDSRLSALDRNRNDAFKDGVRTLEIMARKRMNKDKR